MRLWRPGSSHKPSSSLKPVTSSECSNKYPKHLIQADVVQHSPHCQDSGGGNSEAEELERAGVAQESQESGSDDGDAHNMDDLVAE